MPNSYEPLEGQAKGLVGAARLFAISAFVPLLEQYDFLGECKPEDWDFLATIGTVHVAINDLVLAVTPARFEVLYSSFIFPALNNWNPHGQDAVLDCKQFVRRTLDASDEMSPADALGLWILWNLFQRKPSNEEARSAPVIGRTVASALQDWWN